MIEDYSDNAHMAACGGLLPVIPHAEHRPALREGKSGAWRTREELRDEAQAMARTLTSPNKRLVFILAEMGADTVVSILAAAAAGHAVALVDPAMSGQKIAALLEAYRPDFVLGPAPAPSLLADAGYSEQRLVLDSISLAEPAQETRSQDRNIDPALLLLLATSGTTGSPRFVRLSRSAVLANAIQIADALAIDDESVAIAHLPLHYSYGWSVLASHFVRGASAVLVEDSVMSRSFWDTTAEVGGSHFPGVPFHYTTLARLGLESIPRCVTTFTQAGGPLDLKTQTKMHEFAEERGARFYVMYGQTEASPRMTTLRHESFLDKVGSVGVALPGGRLTIERDGVGLDAGQVGDVVYQGPNVMLGYADRREDLGKGDELNGRLETGDVGYLDADACLFLTGRTKRFAKIAGLRLGLDQLEKDFLPAGAVACVDGRDKVVVFYDEALEAALKDRVKAIALEYKIPAACLSLKRVAAIPRTAGGKINYGRLKEAEGV